MSQFGGNPGQHPTVPYGQPAGQGMGITQQQFDPNQQYYPQSMGPVPQQQAQQQGRPTGFPFAGGQQPQGQQPQGPPQQQPHPTVPYGQFPQQQPPTGQPQPGQVMDDNTILDGPNVPPEMRGRTFGQFKSVYAALANDWLTRGRSNGLAQGVPQGQPQQSWQQQGQAAPGYQMQSQPQGQGQGQPQGQQAAPQRRGWQEEIGQVVEDRVNRLLQPVIQQTTAGAVQQARNVAAQSIPDFGMLEGEIMQRLSGMDQSALANPTVWVNAARMVRGEMMERGQYRPPQGMGQQPPQQPLQQRAVPAPYQYFTEAPTAPQIGQYGGGALNQKELEVAKAMGMSPEEYSLWKGGIQR